MGGKGREEGRSKAAFASSGKDIRQMYRFASEFSLVSLPIWYYSLSF